MRQASTLGCGGFGTTIPRSKMAYGKDESQLSRISGYGGSLGQRTRHMDAAKKRAASRRGGGGGAPYWKGVLKIPTDHSRIVRLIPGQYKQQISIDDETITEEVFEFYMYREHYHGASGRGAICSAGPLYRNRKKSEPCEGCTLFWEDVRERRDKKKRGDKSRGPNRISMSDKYAFTVWDYGLWLQVPDMDRDGNIRTNDQGEPYTSWVMAQPGDPRANQYPWKQGHLLPWPISYTYKETLIDYNDKVVRKDCRTCGTQGSIKSVLKICGNPNCQHPVFDPNDTTLSPEEQQRYENEPYTCPVCHETNFIDEMIECPVCYQHGWEPARASIFDIDLELSATGQPGEKKTVLQILQRSNPRPIQVDDPELLKTIKPLDLVKRFAPTPVEKQRELWDITEIEEQPPRQSLSGPAAIPPGFNMRG